MNVLLTEVGPLGELELFKVQLAERLKCDVGRISVVQGSEGEDLLLWLDMLPIDGEHQGIVASRRFPLAELPPSR